ALPDGSRRTRPAGDNTTSTPTSFNATPSRESAHSMGHACCRWPSPRGVPRTRPTPRPTPATQAPAPRSSKPFSTPITSCRIRSRPRRTAALEPLAGAPLTLGNEIDKLAANIALGRDAAGVHYRSDSIRGLFVGEQQALGLLRDYSRTYNERFDGFIARKFN